MLVQESAKYSVVTFRFLSSQCKLDRQFRRSFLIAENFVNCEVFGKITPVMVSFYSYVVK
jgi:hypothetical protein